MIDPFYNPIQKTMATITPGVLFNHHQCPHRVTLDAFADVKEQDEPNPFVELLWRQSSTQHQTAMDNVPAELNLSTLPTNTREELTRRLMSQRVPLIYGGLLIKEDCKVSPDLLRLETSTSGEQGYVPVFFKSVFAAGETSEGGDSDTEVDSDQANKIAMAVDLLQQFNQSASPLGYVQRPNGQEVPYDLVLPRGTRNPTSLWDDYQTNLTEVRQVLVDKMPTKPAFSAKCKLCHWQTKCSNELEAADDLTLIPELGRSKRDELFSSIKTVGAMASISLNQFITGKKNDKTIFKGIGPATLLKFQQRAKLLATPKQLPYLKEIVTLPNGPEEIHFDIEVDPMRDFCYLHGFVERTTNSISTDHKYIPFLASQVTSDAEEAAFAGAYQYLAERASIPVYYYSPYERTIWKKLALKFPKVCSVDDILAMFSRPHWVDLYTSVVRSKTEWPTHDYSIKTLAKYLGFSWRDIHPSGAASIEWFDRWMNNIEDDSLRDRILAYNEDDCVATGVLSDSIRKLPVLVNP